MKRLAMVGVELIHKFLYPGFINGFDPVLMEKHGGWMASMFREGSTPLDPEVRVVAIASSDPAAADIARVCGIDTIVGQVAELPTDLDGAVIMERRGTKHLELARPFLEAGQFVYIDKPISETREDLEQMRQICLRSGGRLFGGSAVRYSDDLHAIQAALTEMPAESLVVTGPGPWYEYACHSVEILEVLNGPNIDRVSGVGRDAEGLAILGWRSGARATVQWGSYPGEFRVDAYAKGGWRTWTVNDPHAYYRNLAAHMVDGLKGRVDSNWSAMAAIVGILDDVGRNLPN